jgi:hypothetical protein
MEHDERQQAAARRDSAATSTPGSMQSVKELPVEVSAPPSMWTWVAAEVIYPLLPVIAVTVVHGLAQKKFNFGVLDANDFSITMALFCIVMVTVFSRQRDRNKRAWNVLFQLGALAFIIFFAIGGYTEAVTKRNATASRQEIRKNLVVLKTGTLSVIAQDAIVKTEGALTSIETEEADANEIASTIRIVAVAFSVVVIMGALLLRAVIKLEE